MKTLTNYGHGMPPSDGTRQHSNPFATRWIRPGAIPFQFPGEVNSQQLVGQLRKWNWNAAIVGPHGSGKSTLLATLVPELERAGVRVEFVVLHADGGHPLKSVFAKLATLRSSCERFKLLIVDGWEQLSWWSKARIRNAARRRQCGLLVTVHEGRTAKQFPVLYQTCTSLNAFQQLVDKHLPSHCGRISANDIATAYTANRGNVRDALFTLYDLFEARSHAATDLRNERIHL